MNPLDYSRPNSTLPTQGKLPRRLAAGFLVVFVVIVAGGAIYLGMGLLSYRGVLESRRSMVHLAQLCRAYAAQNGGAWPDSLDHLPKGDATLLDLAQDPRFSYHGSGLRWSHPEIITARHRHSTSNDESILFADGHVEFVHADAVSRVVARSARLRAQFHTEEPNGIWRLLTPRR